MKTELINDEKEYKEYPKLIKHSEANTIVLASSGTLGIYTGVCVLGEKIGEYRDDWLNFKELPKGQKIILEND